jgi:hypothetical protein
MCTETPLLFRKLVHCCKHLHVHLLMHLPASSITSVIQGEWHRSHTQSMYSLLQTSAIQGEWHRSNTQSMYSLLQTSAKTLAHASAGNLYNNSSHQGNETGLTPSICPFVQKHQWYHVTDIMCREQEIPCFIFGIQNCFQDTKTWVEGKQAPHLLCPLLAQLLNLRHFHLLPSFA